jgi:hypothetical protein
MGDRIVVCVLLDAFRWDYLNPVDTPLLWKWSEEGVYVHQLRTTTGFSQRTAVFCGTHPDSSGTLTMFGFGPERSPFRFARKWRPVLRLLQRIIDTGVRGASRLDRRLRSVLVEKAEGDTGARVPTGNIPLHLLPLLFLAEDERPIHEPGSLGVESVFDLLRSSGLSYRYIMYPEVNCEDDRVLTLSMEALKEGYDCVFLQFSDVDLEGHRFGPNSEMRRRVAGEIDRKIRVLEKECDDLGLDASWLIASDHGMMEVATHFDVAAEVHATAHRMGWKHGRDYLLFLDSTMARIWGLSERSSPRLLDLFGGPGFEEFGNIVDEERAQRLRIPWSDHKYGDALWRARPGVLISPDYFHRPATRVVGMHGYDPGDCEVTGYRQPPPRYGELGRCVPHPLRSAWHRPAANE